MTQPKAIKEFTAAEDIRAGDLVHEIGSGDGVVSVFRVWIDGGLQTCGFQVVEHVGTPQVPPCYIQTDDSQDILDCPNCEDGLLYYSQSESRWLPCALCGEEETYEQSY